MINSDDGDGDAESLGARLQRLRRDRGMTQRDLAGERYSAAFVSTIESGRRRPSEEALRHFAHQLGTDPEELLTGRPPSVVTELGLDLAKARHAASTGEAANAVQLYRAVRERAARAGLPRIEATALTGLARCAENDGDLERAHRWLDDADACLVDEPATEHVPVICLRGRLLRLAGKLREAAYLLESSRERLEHDGLATPDALMQFSYGLVNVYLELGLKDRAAHAADTARALAAEVSDPEHVAKTYVHVSYTFMAQGRWADAEAALDRAHATYRQLDYQLEIATCHWARGNISSREGRYSEAERELTTARDMLRALNSAYWVGALASELGTVLWRQGRTDEAITALDDAWRLADESPVPSLALAEAHRLRGEIATEAGETTFAEHHLRAALDLFLRAEAGPDAARTARLLGDLLRAQDQPHAALEAYRQGLLAAERSEASAYPPEGDIP